MIRAFNTTDKVYQTNGDAVIQAIKAKVKNSDNGDYYLELTCGSEYNEFIQANNILVVPTPRGDQAFRIRTVTKKSNKLEVKAWHVYYDSQNYLIADSYAVNLNCNSALAHFNNATDNPSPFTMSSDVTSINSYRCVRTSLAECIRTVLERWGGHLVRDNWNISILSDIGVDNGITIEYKKNLKELTASYDWSGVTTKVMPVGKNGILLDERYLYSDIQYTIPFTRSVTFDQDINEEDYPDEQSYIRALKADLRAQAINFLNTYSIPVVNYELKGNPEKVTDIGDMIEVRDKRIGVNILTQVIAYEYDAIADKYVSLEFGNFVPSLDGLMSNISANTNTQIKQATADLNIEVNSLYRSIEAINTNIETLQDNKQDKLYTGDGIKIANNVISLDKLGSYSYENNILAGVNGTTITLFIEVPRPINNFILNDFLLRIYTQGSNVEITPLTTGVSYTLTKVNDYTEKLVITDTNLSGLSGMYNAYLVANIN